MNTLISEAEKKAFFKNRKPVIVKRKDTPTLNKIMDGRKQGIDSLDSNAAYMPDINLHLGFESVAGLARNELKRELTKAERKLLLARYIKAANKHQLVVINQVEAPIQIAGAVWFETCGQKTRLSLLVSKKLGRELTRKEGAFISGQWGALTANKRHAIKDKALTSIVQQGTDGEIYTGRTSGRNVDYKNTFDFGRLKGELKKRLKSGRISHSEYHKKLCVLKEARKKVEDAIRASKDSRDALQTWSFHVVNNTKGLASESLGGARFRVDGFKVEPEHPEGLTRGCSSIAPTKKEKEATNRQYIKAYDSWLMHRDKFNKPR